MKYVNFKTTEGVNFKADLISNSGSEYMFKDNMIYRRSDYWGMVKNSIYLLDDKHKTTRKKEIGVCGRGVLDIDINWFINIQIDTINKSIYPFSLADSYDDILIAFKSCSDSKVSFSYEGFIFIIPQPFMVKSGMNLTDLITRKIVELSEFGNDFDLNKEVPY